MDELVVVPKVGTIQLALLLGLQKVKLGKNYAVIARECKALRRSEWLGAGCISKRL